MSATTISLMGHIGWTILLTVILLISRFVATGKDKHPLNTFAQDGSDIFPLGNRITRAHGNSLEWMVIPASLLVFAAGTGQTAITDGLAMICLYCRVAQSVAHIISTSVPVVLVRATFFTVQVVIWAMWAWQFYGAA